MNQYFLYPLLAALPVWFILYTLKRFISHYKDGDDRTLRTTRYLKLKYVLTFLMCVLMSVRLLELAYLWVFVNIDVEDLLLYTICTGILLLSWCCSLRLLHFEFRKALTMSWIGHRGFWILSFGVYIAVFVLAIIQEPSPIRIKVRIAFYATACAITSALGLLALFRPNEFPLMRYSRFDSRNYAPHLLRQTTDLALRDEIQLSITGYKSKVLSGRQVIYFTILVKIEADSYTVKRTYLEFDTLHRSLRSLFPGEQYPVLSFPEFPAFLNNENLDRRMQKLEEYLNSVKRQHELMSEDFVNFLKLPSPYSDRIIALHTELVCRSKSFATSLQDSLLQQTSLPEILVNTSSVFPTTQPEYFALGLQTWVQVTMPSVTTTTAGVTVYHLSWALPNSDMSGSVERRYSEFFSLHKAMKHALAPAAMPAFPSKNYLQYFGLVDRRAVETRRCELEKYMANVLNDPAFHCSELLEFIECSVGLEELWARGSDHAQYLVAGEATWGPEEEGESYYQRYVFPVSKIFRGTRAADWVFSRRFSEFVTLHQFLVKRNNSPSLNRYLDLRGEVGEVPPLPKKGIIPLTSHEQIEERKKKLVAYVAECFGLQAIRVCYSFRCFIEEPELTE